MGVFHHRKVWGARQRELRFENWDQTFVLRLCRRLFGRIDIRLDVYWRAISADRGAPVFWLLGAFNTGGNAGVKFKCLLGNRKLV